MLVLALGLRSDLSHRYVHSGLNILGGAIQLLQSADADHAVWHMLQEAGPSETNWIGNAGAGNVAFISLVYKASIKRICLDDDAPFSCRHTT